MLLGRDRGLSVHLIEPFQQPQALDADAQRLVGNIGEVHVVADEPRSFVQRAVIDRYRFWFHSIAILARADPPDHTSAADFGGHSAIRALELGV